MTLTTMMILMAAFAAGLVLGGFYFIALWQTVCRLPATGSPARLMLGSPAHGSALGRILLCHGRPLGAAGRGYAGFYCDQKNIDIPFGTTKSG
jgi:hypothetical protein